MAYFYYLHFIFLNSILFVKIQIREARPKITLVVRTAASVGNYDYIVDWEFQTDGIIKVKVIFTAILFIVCIKNIYILLN